MADPSQCVRCGAQVVEGLSADGVCPNCLLTLGLTTNLPIDDQPTVSVSPGSARRPAQGQLLASGQTFGTYDIEQLLGRGGMGEVYEAVDESGRRLALKVLTHGLDDPSDRARFLREGRLAASISHPHTVYVYGTEEIEGIPVITMELVGGGTLKDKVKEHGPLPQAKAVDAILDVIAGLQAAETAGVLHRDIKPSNCFVDGSGSVKVGDFGLSVSTLARTEHDVTELTMTGTFLGTPVFASPEQVRADDLDVRSDIYSVGATLYYLLTGRPPFEEKNVLRLASLIAQERPPAPTDLRPEIPEGLAAVVMRCLAKTREARFDSYAALEAELAPFSSAVPQPASLGLRTAAGAIDWFVVGLLLSPGFIAVQLAAVEPRLTTLALQVLSVALTGAYFGVAESRWGASVGKTLCRLRVVDASGVNPRLGPALVRGLVFALAVRSVGMIAADGEVSTHPGVFTELSVGADTTFGMGMAFPLPFVGTQELAQYWFLGIVLLFVTARRRNGLAGIHGLTSGTRVVLRRDTEPRRVAHAVSDVTVPRSEVRYLGPFQVLEHLDERLVLAYDGRLRRKVWIRSLEPDSPALADRRRDLSRRGRLHWLTGKRAPQENWDAYEAVEGTPLAARLKAPQPWHEVRVWLRDLAAELDEALQDQTLPELALDRIWIATDGRAMLLDWPAPGAGSGSVLTSKLAPQYTGPRFLRFVADSALAGRVFDSITAARSSTPLVPLSARRLLDRLGEASAPSFAQLRPELDILVTGPSAISRRKRLLHLGICGVVPLLAWTHFFPLAAAASFWAYTHAPAMELRIAVDQLESLHRRMTGTPPDRSELEALGFEGTDGEQAVRSLEIYVAGQFASMDISPAEWKGPFMRPLWRPAAERALANHPVPSSAELEAAETVVRPFLVAQVAEWSEPDITEGLVGIAGAIVFPTLFLLPVGVVSLLLAAPFHGGLLLRVLGIAVVTRSGIEISRARALARAVYSWAPLVPTSTIMIHGMIDDFFGRPAAELPDWWVPVLAIPWFVGVVWAGWNPQRGLQDRLAGTYLVPR